jgi:multiple sugar transport system substrate-binding protein
MKFEKLTYVGISAAVIIALILLTYISTPTNIRTERVKKIYYVDNISSAHQKVINRFNEKYKGQIEVVVINLPFEKFSTNERKELLARYLRSKSGRIDVFAVDQIWVPRFAKWGIPMEKHIQPHQRDNLISYAMESCFFNDSLIAIPLYLDIGVMFYRNDLFAGFPEAERLKEKINASLSWQEFLDLQKKLKHKDHYLFPADDYEGLICTFVEMLASRKAGLVTKNELKFNTPEGKEVLQLLVDMVQKYGTTPPEVLRYKENQCYDHYLDHKSAFLRGWPGFLNEKKREDYSIVPTPHFAEGSPKSVFGGWNLMISRFTTRVPEAVKFVNFMISREAQQILVEEGGLLPVNEELYYDEVFLESNPDLVLYHKLMKQGVHRPSMEDYTNISDILSHNIHLAIAGKMSAGEALADAAAKINSGSLLLK